MASGRVCGVEGGSSSSGSRGHDCECVGNRGRFPSCRGGEEDCFCKDYRRLKYGLENVSDIVLHA